MIASKLWFAACLHCQVDDSHSVYNIRLTDGNPAMEFVNVIGHLLLTSEVVYFVLSNLATLFKL